MMTTPRFHDHAVIIASANRPEMLGETLASLQRQSVLPALVILSVTRPEDVPPDAEADGIEVVIGRRGSSLQRNDALDRLPQGIEIVSFLDDDIELDPGYLASIHGFLTEHPEIVIVDGAVLSDGGVTRCEAIRIVAQAPPPAPGFVNSRNAYGCNMTVRRSVAETVRFDERLKLYAWLEDADFTHRCLEHGACARYFAARLVHMRTSVGRVSGKQFGFAQLTNSYYLKKKGHMSAIALLRTHWFPALSANLWGSLSGDRQVDRVGQLKGNLIALSRLARGVCEPEYVERLGESRR
jgi:GT2 family glycosyltransferase